MVLNKICQPKNNYPHFWIRTLCGAGEHWGYKLFVGKNYRGKGGCGFYVYLIPLCTHLPCRRESGLFWSLENGLQRRGCS